MTDRELLELAAKAAGMIVLSEGSVWPKEKIGWFYCCSDNSPSLHDRSSKLLTKWAPLTDDGDALRLIVALRECEPQINIANDGCQVQERYKLAQSDCAPDGDHRANLRRTIVRFAAEIGKEMP